MQFWYNVAYVQRSIAVESCWHFYVTVVKEKWFFENNDLMRPKTKNFKVVKNRIKSLQVHGAEHNTSLVKKFVERNRKSQFYVRKLTLSTKCKISHCIYPFYDAIFQKAFKIHFYNCYCFEFDEKHSALRNLLR